MPSTTRSPLTATVLTLAGALVATPALAAPAAAGAGPREVPGTPLVDATQVEPGVAGLEAADTCPSGTGRGATVLGEGFEDGLPDGGARSQSWTVAQDDPYEGTSYAYSVRPGGGDVAYLQLEDSFVRPGARTFLSFQVKGTSGEDNMGVLVNDDAYTLTGLEPEAWQPVTIDITSATGFFEDGYLDIAFAHVADDRPGSITVLKVDDVAVYHCVPVPSGVRGDWTGGDPGTVDLLSVGRDGVLTLYRGRGDGRIGNGTRMGTGWGGFSWLGSPGDIDDDGRTDLLARGADGSLYRYSGRGDGALARGVRIGTGWGTATALATGADVDNGAVGAGSADLLARFADGSLYRYSLTAAGGLNRGSRIGTGWNGIRTFVPVDDPSGGVDDVLAINGVGDLYLFRGSPDGLVGGSKVGSGWGGVQLVTSPGDLDGDGRSDVVGRTAAGELLLFRGSPSGGLLNGTRIGSGWGGSVRLV